MRAMVVAGLILLLISHPNKFGCSLMKKVVETTASTSVDSMRIAQDFSPGYKSDSSLTQKDSTTSRPDSILKVGQERHGILHRLIEPLVLTALAGGLLLLLFLQRGH